MKNLFNKEALKKSETYCKITRATSFLAGGLLFIEPITASVLLLSSLGTLSYSEKLRDQVRKSDLILKKKKTDDLEKEKTSKAKAFSHFKPNR